MEKNNTEYREIDYTVDSCPPKWCPANKVDPYAEFCCHGCRYCGVEGMYERMFCEHPDAKEDG